MVKILVMKRTSALLQSSVPSVKRMATSVSTVHILGFHRPFVVCQLTNKPLLMLIIPKWRVLPVFHLLRPGKLIPVNGPLISPTVKMMKIPFWSPLWIPIVRYQNLIQCKLLWLTLLLLCLLWIYLIFQLKTLYPLKILTYRPSRTSPRCCQFNFCFYS